MKRHLLIALLAIQSLLVACAADANAHFLWLLRTSGDKPVVQVYFSEAAEPGDSDLLKLVEGSKLWQLDAKQATKLTTTLDDTGLNAVLEASADDRILLAKHQYGVLDRGDEPFLLQYYAKTGPQLGNAAWSSTAAAKLLLLDIEPTKHNDKVRLIVRWQGKPVAGAEVTVSGGKLSDFTAETNKQGVVEFTAEQAALYSIRARHVEQKTGELDGKKYQSIKHYSTLALHVPKPGSKSDSNSRSFADIPQEVTSFGAAITDDALYLYGGHTGAAHSYDNQSQDNQLYHLPLKAGAKWESIAEGPRLQGLAMVATGGKLYRLGGFTAKNAEGEEHDLHSQATATRFDPSTKKWEALPDLPEPRSSFDAAVLGEKIYVVGGWALQGEADSQWHKTAYVLDPTADTLAWQAIAEPPFERRALALAAHDGKLFAIGGMQPKGGPSTDAFVFDPTTAKWSSAPALPGKPMEGFGCSAFATGRRLYVSTISGQLLRLSDDAKSWKPLVATERARFFHRMLPLDDSHLLMIGGANMGEGKFAEIDVVEVE